MPHHRRGRAALRGHGRIGRDTEFNAIKLLNGAGTITFQVGAQDGQVIAVGTASLGSLVGTAAMSLGASTDLAELDTAIDAVSKQRGAFGAVQNRLEYTLEQPLGLRGEPDGSESRIRDVDMAKEMATMTKEQILKQAGTSMLAQANQGPQGVLSLLQG